MTEFTNKYSSCLVRYRWGAGSIPAFIFYLWLDWKMGLISSCSREQPKGKPGDRRKSFDSWQSAGSTHSSRALVRSLVPPREDGQQAGSSGRRGWLGGRGHKPGPFEYVRTQGLHGIQPLDLHQFREQLRDAVACRADAVEELHAIRHAPNLIPLQSKALGEVAPRFHNSLLGVVCGAEHSARLLKAVEWQLCGAETCRDKGPRSDIANGS